MHFFKYRVCLNITFCYKIDWNYFRFPIYCVRNKLIVIVRGSCRRRAVTFCTHRKLPKKRPREGWIRPPLGNPPHRPPAGVSSTRVWLRRSVRLCSTVVEQSAPAPFLSCSTRASATLPAPWGFVRHGFLPLRGRFAARLIFYINTPTSCTGL